MTSVVQPSAWRTAISEQTETQAFIAWTLERFGHLRMALTTQFGMEGCALIDMYARAGAELAVVYLDTGFLFPETHALRARLAERYPTLTFEDRGTSLTPEDQASRHGGQLWARDPTRCCGLRKVEPMAQALAGVDVWVSGITRSQSRARADAPLIGWDWQFQLLKVSPLVAWDRKRIWEYVQAHDVPFNPLHLQGYPTIGCTHCTKAVPGHSVGDYTRLGRWDNSGKTECGLHVNGSGI